MCRMSMVMNHRRHLWNQRTRPPLPVTVPMISREEILEFRDLLQRARQYDREHDQPDCELADKKKQLLDLAGDLGADVQAVEDALSVE